MKQEESLMKQKESLAKQKESVGKQEEAYIKQAENFYQEEEKEVQRIKKTLGELAKNTDLSHAFVDASFSQEAAIVRKENLLAIQKKDIDLMVEMHHLIYKTNVIGNTS